MQTIWLTYIDYVCSSRSHQGTTGTSLTQNARVLIQKNFTHNMLAREQFEVYLSALDMYIAHDEE